MEDPRGLENESEIPAVVHKRQYSEFHFNLNAGLMPSDYMPTPIFSRQLFYRSVLQREEYSSTDRYHRVGRLYM